MKFVTYQKKFSTTPSPTGAFEIFVGSRKENRVEARLPYRTSGRLGFLVGENVIDLEAASLKFGMHTTDKPENGLPSDIIYFLALGSDAYAQSKEVFAWCMSKTDDELRLLGVCAGSLSDTPLLAPVPRPSSMRDGYAFRQHVEAARRNRGVEMIPEFDQFPVFYFTNHGAVIGPGPMEVMPEHLKKLDFELEAAIVIGKEGRNIKAADADEYIFGYMVMNDWSARYLQMEEMKLSLGPAKGKDFATAIGPYLVTRDELAPRRIPGPVGERYDLAMTCRVGAEEVSRGNLKDMSWTFAQIIERASYGVTLYPGDVIGSGTVGTGCFLELNGSKVYDNRWLGIGDEVTCSIEMLGDLTNTVVAMK
ncbi:MAG TPA: fumarylacetoacetate hydrolase family protein [Candidatus Kapabacteria bacterium]|nr:fumarylacetoacetate hydrolase family protein [Candidatus Kapabacteria bacterium]